MTAPVGRSIPEELSAVVKQGQLNMAAAGYGIAIQIPGTSAGEYPGVGWKDWSQSLLDHAEEINTSYDAWLEANNVEATLRPHESLALTLALNELHSTGDLDPAIAKVCILALGRVCEKVGYDDEEVTYSIGEATTSDDSAGVGAGWSVRGQEET